MKREKERKKERERERERERETLNGTINKMAAAITNGAERPETTE